MTSHTLTSETVPLAQWRRVMWPCGRLGCLPRFCRGSAADLPRFCRHRVFYPGSAAVPPCAAGRSSGRPAAPQRPATLFCRWPAASASLARSLFVFSRRRAFSFERPFAARPPHPPPTTMSTKLFIGSLAWGVTDTSLKEAFAPFGEIVEGTHRADTPVSPRRPSPLFPLRPARYPPRAHPPRAACRPALPSPALRPRPWRAWPRVNRVC